MTRNGTYGVFGIFLGSVMALAISPAVAAPVDETPPANGNGEVAQPVDAAPTAPTSAPAMTGPPASVSTSGTTTTAKPSEEEEKEESWLPVTLGLTTSLSSSAGNLFADRYQITNAVRSSIGLSVSYDIIDKLSASISGSWSKNLTRYGGSQEQYESRFRDIDYSLSYGGFYKIPVVGVSMSASLGGTLLPVSRASRFEGLYTTVSPGLSLSRKFGDLRLGYSIGFSKNFHEYTSIVVDTDDYPVDVLARDGGAEQLSRTEIALSGVLPSHSLSHSLSVSYSWFKGFSTSLGWSFSDSWSYDNGTNTRDDEFTSPNANPGRGHSQSMSGRIAASYAFLDHFNAGLSMSTGGPPLTADNKRVRFPFFDTQSGNLQYTSFGLSLGATY